MFIQREKSNYGNLLYEARCKSKIAESVEKQKFLFEANLLSFGVFLFIEIYLLKVYLLNIDINLLAESHISWFTIAATVAVAVGGFYSLLVIATTSFSKDCIYENGITSFNHNLIDYLLNRVFHSYKDITKIEIGKFKSSTSFHPVEFMVIHEKGRKATTLYSSWYRNDYWEILKQVLKEKCPQASWIWLPEEEGSAEHIHHLNQKWRKKHYQGA